MWLDADAFYKICLGIVAFAGACGAIWKWILPAVRLSNRVEAVESRTEDQEAAIGELVESNNLMLECMVYLIRNARTKNSIVDLEKMEHKIIKYMANRGGST